MRKSTGRGGVQAEIMLRDHLVRALLLDHDLRVLVVHATGICREAAVLQNCEPTAAVVLAHTICGAALLGGLGKADDRVTLQLEGPGPLRGLFVDAGAQGELRAYVRNPRVNFPGREGGDLHMSLGAGGYLSVVRELQEGEFYRGVVALDATRLDRVLEAYFAQSEQIDTALAIDVETDGDTIERATAMLVQRLPGGNTKELARIRKRLHAGALQRSLWNGEVGGLRVAGAALENAGELELLEDVPLRLVCTCSRERALRGVAAAGREEILDMVARDKGAELVCEFCKTAYRFSAAELLEVLDNLG